MTQRKKVKRKSVELRLTIDEIGAGGDGVGHFQGKPVYVPKAAPGDTLKVRAEEAADGYYGHIAEIEKASPQRVLPPCPHYGQCGGCALQHISTEDYHDWKIAKVRAILDRSGLTPSYWDDPAFLPAATRRRTNMAVLRTADHLIMGYNAPRSHQITPVSSCLILETELDGLLQKLRPYLAKLAPPRIALDITVQLVEGAFDVVLGGPWREGGFFTLEQNEALSAMLNELDLARISLREKVGGELEVLLSCKSVLKRFSALNVPLPPGAFLQASEAGESVLTDFVLAHTQGAQNMADLFCGCGTFAGHLLARGAKVYAADSEGDAIKALKHPQLTAQKRNLFKDPLSAQELTAFDAVVIDPPRAGAKEQFRILAESDVQTIVSISCNPATFARDAQILIEGGYVFERLKLVDQFVWSSHVELAGVFRRA